MFQTQPKKVKQRLFYLSVLAICVSFAAFIFGIVIGRTQYEKIAPVIYPMIFVKEFIDNDISFKSYIAREKRFIVGVEPAPAFHLGISQLVQDELNADLNKIESEGGNLSDTMKTYRRIKLTDNSGTSFSGKFRLKGNQPDHRQSGSFPSINVRLKNGHVYYGMTDFTLQKPGSRNWLWELIAYKMFSSEGLIAPKAEYVRLSVNNQDYGLYLVHDRISKKYMEHNNRRASVVLEIENKDPQNDFELGGFKLFDSKKTPFVRSMNFNKSDELANLRSSVTKKLSGYINGRYNLSEVFDLEQVAKLAAIKELLLSSEIQYDEIKWYFNPISELLEPIDMDTHTGYFSDKKNSSNVCVPNLPSKESFFSTQLGQESKQLDHFFAKFFENTTFLEKYYNALRTYSSDKYLNSFFSAQSTYLQRQEDLLRLTLTRRNTPYLDNSIKEIYDRAKLIRKIIAMPDTITGHMSYDQGKVLLNLTNGSSSNIYKITEIRGDKLYKSLRIPKPVTLVPHEKKTIKFDIDQLLPTETKKKPLNLIVTYKIPGDPPSNQVFEQRIPLQTPYKKSNHRVISRQTINSEPEVLDNHWFVSDGTVLIKRDLLVSSDTTFHDLNVSVSEGVTISLSNSARLMFTGAFSAAGSKKKPVQFDTSDGSGVLVFASHGKLVELKHTKFKDFNLHTNIPDKFFTTSAINITGSRIQLEQVQVNNVIGEDSLNIVNSRGSINSLSIEGNTLSDCMDVDFSMLRIDNLITQTCGNDGIDFSFSNVTGKNFFSQRVGDKALSVGENTKLDLKELTAKGGLIGVAVKDGSKVKLSGANLTEFNYSFVLYNKKTGFLPSELTLEKYNLSDIGEQHFSKIGNAKVIINGKKMDTIPLFPEKLID